MTCFSAAIDAIFRDANMAADAVYRACGSNVDVPCRVILAMPDDLTDFSVAGVVSPTMRIDVRVSEVAAPTEGDRFVIGGDVFLAQGTPMRDSLRLVWRIDAVPEERDDA